MTNINAMFPTKYLKAGVELEDGETAVVTIKSVAVENVGQGEDAEPKPVVYFKESDKGLVCNKTNGKTIASMHGPETDNWVGKRITLIATDVQFGDKTMLGLRVRSTAPKADAKTGFPVRAGKAEAGAEGPNF